MVFGIECVNCLSSSFIESIYVFKVEIVCFENEFGEDLGYAVKTST